MYKKYYMSSYRAYMYFTFCSPSREVHLLNQLPKLSFKYCKLEQKGAEKINFVFRPWNGRK
jgi:hypothetical protein